MATALLEKQDVKKQDDQTAELAEGEAKPVEYRWTVDAFVKAFDAGVFGYDARLELIQGRIFEIMGQGPRHSTLASVIADMLRDAAERQFAVREEKPVRIAADSQPIPDILVLNGKQTDYNERQPEAADVALLVEVSVTTLDDDLGGKAQRYARAGIREYWTVAEKEDAIIVHREPSPEGYLSVTRLIGTNRLSPLAMPNTAWTVNGLLGKEG